MFCMSCGKQIPDEAAFCPICGATVAVIAPAPEAATLSDTSVPLVEKVSPAAKESPAPKKKSNVGFIIGVISIAVVGFFFIIVMIGYTSSVANGNKTNTKPTVEVTETKEEYIASCQALDYTEISRNPSLYASQRVAFSGKVIQVSESYGKTIMRVDTTEGEYGLWEDTIYVTYQKLTDDESRILENDIINLYGEYKGIKSYTAVLGNEISIPEIEAKYVELSGTVQ